MSKEHSVIVIPGLGNDTSKLEWAIQHWRNHGLEPLVHSVDWHKDEFQSKLERLVDLVDELSDKGDVVSLVGTSAGGSAVLNAFIERKDVIHRVVNVCGRLRTGAQAGFRSFEARTASSPAFAQAVKLFESREDTLTERDRQKIMTVRAMFGDELVPGDTTILEGAYNTQVPTPEHMLSIGAALTIFSQPVILFLKGEQIR
ncbi:MAG: hypothetical protein US86_C0002G0079 [Candidatus Daviesbacteria bacterium GW2011_GWA2_38_24]|uniref:AB hydrolase-1 domain-containing protein n=1 Tax=Candidatus Daviesbacteria bacterium GW2011_GWA2_38_24 TaxID=1618422 RepID=A0A0G0JJE2_9BACT|nr:MAG: hypothetical protein US86_C0002G0079 [Candidatus Daviesbacteria bacterium GW2011_GWA2_38_24]